jgi:hypothetical protein
VASYAAALSDGSAFFSAHVAGFDIGCAQGESEDENGRRHDRGDHSWSDRHFSSRSSEGYGGNCGCATSAYFGGSTSIVPPTSEVPIPPAAWLFASGLVGMVGVSRRSRMNVN